MAASGTNIVDANVWLALVAADHLHHTVALAWFDEQRDGSCAFCRITQMALLRHLTNAKVMGDGNAVSQAGAWECFEHLVRDPRVNFANEPVGLEEQFRQLTRSAHSKHSAWTDAYLAAFAKAGAYGIVTLDKYFLGMSDLRVTWLRNA
ncbi:MAG: PIN domain-containing protein [Verrucomicrobiae bacterium]|nr:PIN domain-containing protein [Verrucomicrobiae bacterium]